MDKFILSPGETKIVYFFLNLDGRVYFKIRNQSKSNRLKAWWIKGPFGSEEAIPDLVSGGSVDMKGVLWGKLKVGGADSRTIIYITDQAKISYSFPDIKF